MRSWHREEPATWDAAKQAAFGALSPRLFGLGAPAEGDALADEWWRAEEDGAVVGYGRLDESWGDAEVLMIVHPDHRRRGVGRYVLDRLEEEASARHLNYVYNVVPLTLDDRDDVAAWLVAQGFAEKADGEYRKQVPRDDPR